jgi:hypothetical protein
VFWGLSHSSKKIVAILLKIPKIAIDSELVFRQNTKSQHIKEVLFMDTTKIDNLIALYEKRVGTLKNLKSLIESDPKLSSEVIQAFSSDNISLTDKRRNSKSKKPGQYDRMVALLKDGRWRTLPEIAKEIDAKKSSIAPYLYDEKTKDKFESRKHPNRPRMKQWRLKIESEQNSPEHDDKTVNK